MSGKEFDSKTIDSHTLSPDKHRAIADAPFTNCNSLLSIADFSDLLTQTGYLPENTSDLAQWSSNFTPRQSPLLSTRNDASHETQSQGHPSFSLPTINPHGTTSSLPQLQQDDMSQALDSMIDFPMSAPCPGSLAFLGGPSDDDENALLQTSLCVSPGLSVEEAYDPSIDISWTAQSPGRFQLLSTLDDRSRGHAALDQNDTMDMDHGWNKGDGLEGSDREQNPRHQKVPRTSSILGSTQPTRQGGRTSPCMSSSTLPKSDSMHAARAEDPRDTGQSSTSIRCANCSTQNTSLWRHHHDGHTLCNACALFYKLHGRLRPLSMKTDVIRRRNRNGTNNLAARSARPPQTSVRRGSIEQVSTSKSGRRDNPSRLPQCTAGVPNSDIPNRKSSVIGATAPPLTTGARMGASTDRTVGQETPTTSQPRMVKGPGSDQENNTCAPSRPDMVAPGPEAANPAPQSNSIHGRQGAGHKWEWLTMTL